VRTSSNGGHSRNHSSGGSGKNYSREASGGDGSSLHSRKPSHLFIDTGDSRIDVAEEAILSPRTAALFDDLSAPKPAKTNYQYMDDSLLSPIAQNPSSPLDSDSTNGKGNVFNWKTLVDATDGLPTPSPTVTNNRCTNTDKDDRLVIDKALRELASYNPNPIPNRVIGVIGTDQAAADDERRNRLFRRTQDGWLVH
jgi:hypothetical protein